MSTEGLAKRMTDLGCPINQSAIWKIENGDPPRRVTYDEALAMAEVFGLPLEELSVAPEAAADREAIRLFDELRRAQQETRDARTRLSVHVSAHPTTWAAIEEHMENLAQEWLREAEKAMDEHPEWVREDVREERRKHE
jgi:transcriptional regulator with XRE-family HTH domain